MHKIVGGVWPMTLVQGMRNISNRFFVKPMEEREFGRT
jgi:hypothetical protein